MALTHQIIECRNRSCWIGDYSASTSQVDLIVEPEDEINALNHTTAFQPAVILLGYDVRKAATDVFIEYILAESSQSKIIVIGQQLNDEQILNCLLAGANGYMEYSALEKYLNKAVRVIASGEAWISRKMAAKLINKLRTN